MQSLPSISAEISAPQSTLHDSLGLIFKAENPKEAQPADISPLKRVDEQELYAALTHQWLLREKPDLARRFSNDLESATASYRGNHADTNMFKIADRLTRGYVRERRLSHEQYQSLRAEALGRAQLDSDRTRLDSAKRPELKDGDSAMRSVSTAEKKIATNAPANEAEVAQFLAHEAETPRHVTTQVANDAQVSAAGASDTSVPKGFLWKPVSDSDGKLVILAPPNLTGRIGSVTVLDPQAKKTLATGRYSGTGNGNREHFRFSEPGSSFPDGAAVAISLKDGGSVVVKITAAAARVEGT